MQKYRNKHIFIGFAENSHLCLNFCKGYTWRFFTLSAEKFIFTDLAIFDFFQSKKHDSIGIINFCLKLLEKITKNKKIMIINIFDSIFCLFLKTHRFWLSFQYRNHFCMQKYPNKHIFIGFAENSHLCLNFCKGNSLAIF